MSSGRSWRQRRQRWRRVAIAVVVAVVGVDLAAGAMWAASGARRAVTGYPGSSADVVRALVVDEHRSLVATRDGEVALVVDGQVLARQRVGGSISALAGEAGRYYVGTTLGAVTGYDDRLAERSRLEVGDSVVAMGTGPAGELIVVHGAGAFSTRYVVDRFPPGGVGAQPVARVRAVFTVTAAAAQDRRLVYGTVNSRVGLTDLDGPGRSLWTVSVSHPVTAIQLLGDRNRILVGDRAGGVELIAGDDGRSLGRVQLSEHPITALGFDRVSGTIVAGDQRGGLAVLDEHGSPVLRRPGSGGAVQAIGTTPDGMLVIPQSGEWSRVDPGAVRAAGRAGMVLPWVIALNAVGAAVAVAALLLADPARRSRAARIGRLAWRGRLGYLLVLPTVVLIAVFTLYPVVNAFYLSFTDFSLRAAAQWVGLSNYRELFGADTYFRAGLVNMAIIVVASFLKTVTVPLLAAELVYWLKNRVHQYVFRTMFVLSAVVPTLVLTLLWRQVYDPETGLLNKILALVGLGGWQRAWLGDEDTALWAVIGVGFPFLSAFAFLIFLGGLLTVNRELYDAAAIDGAGSWRRFQYVDLPHLRPQFRIMTFFAVVGSIDGFASIFILTRGGPGDSTYVPALQMYERTGTGELGYASAIGVVLFVLILATTVSILRFRRTELERG